MKNKKKFADITVITFFTKLYLIFYNINKGQKLLNRTWNKSISKLHNFLDSLTFFIHLFQ